MHSNESGTVPGPSDFIVYVDESGDHSLERIDDAYPVFVLAFCIFYKHNYVDKVVSAVERLKFKTFGHDIVILHEREIRKETGIFKFRHRLEKEQFLRDLTGIIADSNFILVSCVIDKRRLRVEAGDANNPYDVALGICLETLHEFLAEKHQQNRETHIVFERRGQREDLELELEFRRFCDGANSLGKRLPFKMVLADKKVNSTGLQLADLVARPIGISLLRPDQKNRAFEVLKNKFYCRGGRMMLGQDFEGWGLKIIPSSDSEKPR